jgi:UDP-GlcNAc:undecaprenyl-phosphate/decaprenyl-phosphate GlcNAc-1-phosphate transferase
VTQLVAIPSDSPLSWIAPLLFGCAAALVFTPLARRIAVAAGDIDRPVGAKIHTRNTPLMGGAAVYAAFALCVLLFVPLSRPVIGVLVGGAVAVSIGIVDELFTLQPLAHLAGQVATAVLGIVFGLGVVKTISVPFASLSSPGQEIWLPVGIAFTIFWLVGMMNTMNFLDGLDGLAAGVAGLCALLLAVWATEHQRFGLPIGHYQDLVLPIALVGAVLGFLPYNWHQARIFLGDSGSMFLGFAVGALSIVGATKLGTALLVLTIPILDVVWAIVRRQMRGRSFLTGDKEHVYHRMLALGFSHTGTVLVLYSLVFTLGALDLLLFKVAKLVAFAIFALATAASFVLLEMLSSSRAHLADQTEGQ